MSLEMCNSDGGVKRKDILQGRKSMIEIWNMFWAHTLKIRNGPLWSIEVHKFKEPREQKANRDLEWSKLGMQPDHRFTESMPLYNNSKVNNRTHKANSKWIE